jgi:Tol biopolymer transport system component
VDRNGKELEVVGDQGEVRTPAISPQGDRIAFTMDDPRTGTSDIWVRDLARGTNSRLTFGPPDHIAPVWSPDGKWIAYRLSRNGPSDIAVKAADGTGDERILLKGDTVAFPTDWSRDGRYLAFSEGNKAGNTDLWVLPASGDGKPISVLATPFNENNGMFSPDARFMAYSSNESGRSEIYVRRFPGPGGKWQVSTAGGADPHWSADGKEITYRAPEVPDRRAARPRRHGADDGGAELVGGAGEEIVRHPFVFAPLTPTLSPLRRARVLSEARREQAVSIPSPPAGGEGEGERGFHQ